MQAPNGRSYSRHASRQLQLALSVLLLVVVAIWFGRAVTFDFINYDENRHVVNNELIRSLSPASIRAMFTDFSRRSYYPVRQLSFAVDYAIWGLDPAGYHLTNIVLHATNTALVFLLILRAIRRFLPEHDQTDEGGGDTGGVLAAAFGGAMFAIHPVVVEPVTWVSGREELLMVLFGLLCVHAHQTAREYEEQRHRGVIASSKAAWSWHLAAWTCFVCACMSNAVGAVIPALVLMHDVLIERVRSFWRIVGGHWPMWAMGAGAVLLKLANQDVQPVGEPEHRTLLMMSIPERVYTVLALYGFNLKTVVWPSELVLIYPNLLSTSLFALATMVGLVLMVMTVVVLWKIRDKKLALAGLMWFLLALAPSAQLLPHHIFRADRFLYLPMVGVAWLGAAVVFARIREAKRGWPTAAAATVLLTILALLTWRQVGYWPDTISIFSQTIRHNKVDPQPYNLRALAYSQQDRNDLALADLNRAVELKSDEAGYYVNRATVFEALGRQAESIADYTRALELQSADAEAYANRGKVLLDQEKYDQAVADLGKAIALQLQDASAYYSRGNAYAGLGRLDEAVADFSEAIRLQPEYIEAYNNRGSVYLQQGREAEAVADFEKAIEIDPSYVGGLVNLGNLHAQKGRYREAVPFFARALSVEPGNAKALWARARACMLMNRPDLAAADYERLFVIEPTNPAVHKEWGNACAGKRALEQAVDHYSRAIELAPNDADTYNRRGIAWAKLGKLDQAIIDFDKAIEIAPADLAGYANRGLAYARLEAFDKARADWQRLVELDPNGPVGAKARHSLEELGDTSWGPVQSKPAASEPAEAGQ